MTKVFNAKNFTWTKNKGTAFVSDVFGNSRVDSDMIIRGLTKDIMFEGESIEHDREGDIVLFQYKSKCGTFEINLFND